MTDHYQTLGVGEGAGPDEIKKAYRRLANQHHPDKGGDQAKFKDISVAYDILSNAQKKAEYDNQRMYGGGPQVRFTSGDPFGDMFGQHNPFAGTPFQDIFGARRSGRNRDLNIQCQVSLADSFHGKQLEANYQLPSGRMQTVVINVPAGVSHGETIRYPGLGDDSIPHQQRGHLNVTVVVMPDPVYQRIGDDLYTNIDINPIEAMVGCRKRIRTISGKDMEVEIRAGVEAGTEYAADGGGFTSPHTGRRGRFVSVVRIKTPHISNPDIIARLKQLNEEISNNNI